MLEVEFKWIYFNIDGYSMVFEGETTFMASGLLYGIQYPLRKRTTLEEKNLFLEEQSLSC